MGITYKLLTTRLDIEAFCLRAELEKIYESWGDFKNWIKCPELIKLVGVACDGEDIIGWSPLRVYYNDWCYTSGAYVRPIYRRRGIGTELMKMIQNNTNEPVIVCIDSPERKSFFGNVELVNNKYFYSKF